jgi:hypothetical protein
LEALPTQITSTAIKREFSNKVRVSTAATSKNGNTSERTVSGETAQFDDPLSYSSNFARALFVLRQTKSTEVREPEGKTNNFCLDLSTLSMGRGRRVRKCFSFTITCFIANWTKSQIAPMAIV